MPKKEVLKRQYLSRTKNLMSWYRIWCNVTNWKVLTRNASAIRSHPFSRLRVLTRWFNFTLCRMRKQLVLRADLHVFPSCEKILHPWDDDSPCSAQCPNYQPKHHHPEYLLEDVAKRPGNKVTTILSQFADSNKSHNVLLYSYWI